MTMQLVKVSASGRGYQMRFTGADAGKEAIAQTKKYLGRKRFNLLVDAIRSGGYSFRAIRMYSILAGVEGFPVNAMIRAYHPRYLSRFGDKR